NCDIAGTRRDVTVSRLDCEEACDPDLEWEAFRLGERRLLHGAAYRRRRRVLALLMDWTGAGPPAQLGGRLARNRRHLPPPADPPRVHGAQGGRVPRDVLRDAR